MVVYLDNAATTRALDSVRELMMEVLDKHYGNPSSLHQKGWDAEKIMNQAREKIAFHLKCKAKEVIFTSGGTEANNLALLGTARAYQRNGKHIVSTCIEHPSVYEPLCYLEENGFEVTYLSVDKNGHVNGDELVESIRKDTILLSIMAINNEIGSVQRLGEIARAAKEKNPSVLFHVDAIQAFGKFVICPKKLGVDLLSVSGHKIHGPKGIGFLYKADKIKTRAILFGGGQEKGIRSGTENVPGIAGIGKAVDEIFKDHKSNMEKMFAMKKRLIQGAKEITGTIIYGMDGLPLMDTAPHIISISFSGIKSEVLLHALEEKGIYVSSGSACSSNRPSISSTLQAIGVKKECLNSTLRFSLSVFTTEEEIDYTIRMLRELVPLLKKYQRH